MPKKLRPTERIDFIQSRVPHARWARMKTLAVSQAKDGTLGNLFSAEFLAFMAAKPWLKEGWLRPQAECGVYKGKPTGFKQVNMPLSNLDAAGVNILSVEHPQSAVVTSLVPRTPVLDAAMASGWNDLIKYLAEVLGVQSRAAFTYTFAEWIATKYDDAPGVKYERTVAPSRYGVRPRRALN